MRTIHGVLAGTFLLAANADATGPWFSPSHPGAPAVQLPAGGEPVLYDQSAPPGASGSYNVTDDLTDPAWASEGADDFEVTGAGWDVTGFTFEVGFVQMSGALFTGPALYNAQVHLDENGLPGATVPCGGEDLQGTRLDPLSNYGTVVVPLMAPCSLPAGRYWLVFSIAIEFPPSAMWHYAGSESFLLRSPLWRNPGDGYGYGCTIWEPVLECLNGNLGGGKPNFRFQVLGTPTVLPEIVFSDGFED